jgi:hypothetical protein
MFGIEDGLVALAYLLCLASTVLCVIYAWLNWNRGDETVEESDQRWEREEHQVEENM